MNADAKTGSTTMAQRAVQAVEALTVVAVVVFIVMLFANSPTEPPPAPVVAATAANAGSTGAGSGSGGAAAPGVDGRAIYRRSCAGCHGGDGSGGIGPRLAGRVVARFPDAADQAAVIANGRGGMPGFGSRLSDAEIAAVVEYTRAAFTS